MLQPTDFLEFFHQIDFSFGVEKLIGVESFQKAGLDIHAGNLQLSTPLYGLDLTMMFSVLNASMQKISGKMNLN